MRSLRKFEIAGTEVVIKLKERGQAHLPDLRGFPTIFAYRLTQVSKGQMQEIQRVMPVMRSDASRIAPMRSRYAVADSGSQLP